MLKQDISNATTLVAVYGAALASFTFGWTLYRDLRDKAKIKLTVSVRRIGTRVDHSLFYVEPSQEFPGLSEELYLVISVVNVGRRRMRWSGVGGHYKVPVNGKSGFVLSARHLPQTLEEQGALDEYTELPTSFIEGNVKRMYVWDVAGRHWNVSRKDLKRVAKDGKKYSQQPNTAED